MLVRDLGDRFQIVLQPDHGVLSGQIAAAWRQDDLHLDSQTAQALVLAAARHDDGWSVWERHPRLNGDQEPQSFLESPRESLLSSYSACVDVLTLDSPAAALLVSMHVSGLNRNRYGAMDSQETTPLDDLAPPIRDFVIHEERRQARLATDLNFDERQRWRAYRQLQVYDVLSLYLGTADLDKDETQTIADFELTPIAPTTIACDPFPFAADPTHVTIAKRLVPKKDWPDDESFQRDFAAAQDETTAIALTRIP